MALAVEAVAQAFAEAESSMLVESGFLWFETAEDSRRIGQCIRHHFHLPAKVVGLVVVFEAQLKSGVFRVKGKHLGEEPAAVVAVFKQGSGIRF